MSGDCLILTSFSLCHQLLEMTGLQHLSYSSVSASFGHLELLAVCDFNTTSHSHTDLSALTFSTATMMPNPKGDVKGRFFTQCIEGQCWRTMTSPLNLSISGNTFPLCLFPSATVHPCSLTTLSICPSPIFLPHLVWSANYPDTYPPEFLLPWFIVPTHSSLPHLILSAHHCILICFHLPAPCLTLSSYFYALALFPPCSQSYCRITTHKIDQMSKNPNVSLCSFDFICFSLSAHQQINLFYPTWLTKNHSFTQPGSPLSLLQGTICSLWSPTSLSHQELHSSFSANCSRAVLILNDIFLQRCQLNGMLKHAKYDFYQSEEGSQTKTSPCSLGMQPDSLK